MATLERTLVFSSSATANDATTIDGSYTFVSVSGTQFKANGPMLTAWGADTTNLGYAAIWDALQIGGRITQDTSADQKLGPEVLGDYNPSAQISGIDVSAETAAVQALFVNQQILQTSINEIATAINLRTRNYNILLTYLINFKIMNALSTTTTTTS